MIEKFWPSISPLSFTANGTVDGLITLVSVDRLKTKQEVFVKASGQDTLPLEVKRVLSKTQLIVGPRNTSLSTVTDLTLYTVAGGATIEAHEQRRPAIPLQEHERAVYEEEPTVAKRVFLVDQFGDTFDTNNPFPVDVTVTGEPDPENSFVFRNAYATAGVEESQVLPTNTKKLYVAVEDLSAKIRTSFTLSGTITGGGADYITTHVGNSYFREGLKLVGKTLYYQANKSGIIIEIEAWV